MSLKQYNITAKEQVTHSRTKRLPVIVGSDSYVDGGESQEWNFTGPWSAMLAKFNGLTGTLTERLDATLTRSADGKFGELRYTLTNYIPAEEATQGDPDGVLPGGGRENPSYDLTTSEASAPLLTHPNFENISGEGARAFKMLMDGYAASDMFDESRTIGEVAEGASAELFKLVEKGVTEYLVQRVTLTARYKSSSPVTDSGMAIKDPPGPLGKAANGRNWLFVGATQNVQGREIWVTETYKLSGPGGWEKSLY